MSTTLEQLRQEIGAELDEIIVGFTTADGTLSVMYDRTLIDPLETEEALVGAWVWMLDLFSSDERRISEYDPSTGKVTFSRAWSAARVGGKDYEIHKLIRPWDLLRIILKVVDSLTYWYQQPITVVSGQRNYDLSAYTWLTEPRQVEDVFWRTGDTVNRYGYIPLDWFEVVSRDGKLYLDVPPYSATSGDTMYLKAWRSYSSAVLILDSSTTDAPKEWIKSGALLRCYEHLMRHGPAQDTERWKRQMVAEALRFRELCKRYTPRPRTRVQLPGGVRHGGINSEIVTW